MARVVNVYSCEMGGLPIGKVISGRVVKVEVANGTGVTGRL